MRHRPSAPVIASIAIHIVIGAVALPMLVVPRGIGWMFGVQTTERPSERIRYIEVAPAREHPDGGASPTAVRDRQPETRSSLPADPTTNPVASDGERSARGDGGSGMDAPGVALVPSQGDWSLEAGGRRYGLDSGRVYLGKLSVPALVLGLIPISGGGALCLPTGCSVVTLTNPGVSERAARIAAATAGALPRTAPPPG